MRARRVVVAVPLGVLKEAAGAPPEPLGTPAAEVASWRVSRAPNGLSFEPPLGGAPTGNLEGVSLFTLLVTVAV